MKILKKRGLEIDPVVHQIQYSTKWSNTLKQFRRLLPTTWLSVFDHFVLA